eukprot:Seg943.10 transcript_id=Seg943.10/GoldUCD/mRNA.D3Y31 product="Craniofacial development protein 2" protein_id=Seg943.10/GoldUCD/D3Y31
MNIRGIKSKIQDIRSLAEESALDVLVFTETKLEKNEKREIEGYNEYNLNRNTAAGGICIFVKENIEAKEIKRNKNCETMWIRLEGKQDELILGTYSPCEGITRKNTIKEFVGALELDLKVNYPNDKAVIMVGDFNAHMGNDEQGINGNNKEIGMNGREYRDLIKRNELTLVNNTKKCMGKWTREQGNQRSILDVTIANNIALNQIVRLDIDEEAKYSVESKMCKTDHRISIIEYELKHEKKRNKFKTIRVTENQWESYREKLRSTIKQNHNKTKEKATIT